MYESVLGGSTDWIDVMKDWSVICMRFEMIQIIMMVSMLGNY